MVSISTASRLVFVDGSIAGLPQALRHCSPEAEVHVLDSGQDGLLAMAEAARSRGGFGAIDVFCHGAPGQLRLGSATLDPASLPLYATELRAIGEALDDGGGLLLYGCDAGRGESGQSFVCSIARLAGVPVAAAEAAVGAAELGGNWSLPVTIGRSAVEPLRPEWRGVLAVITGDGGSNTLTGTEGSDEIYGLGGSDFLEGLGGNDLLDGGSGFDWAVYRNTLAAVNVSLALTGAQNTGGAGSDTLVNIEALRGSAFNDTLLGSSRLVFESFWGGAGDDLIDGGEITDPNGGSNYNQVEYALGATTGVNVNLKTGIASDGQGGTDTLQNINQVVGTGFNDTLIGSDTSLFEIFDGGAGDDYIDGGSLSAAGARVVYTSSPAAVSVDLLTGSASDGYGDTDTLVNIGQVRGSRFDDTLRGDDNTNALDGRAGNDVIDGRGGFDSVRFDAATAGIVVILAGAGSGTAQDGLGGVDTITNIEGVRGTAFADSITGSSGNGIFESFEGQGGDDTIDGGIVTDTLRRSDRNEATYLLSPGPVTVNFATGKAQDGWGGTDTLVNINDVRGSAFGDSLLGSSGGMFEDLEGNAGNDLIDGGIIADIINFDDSNAARYTRAPAGVTVDLAAGTAADGNGGTDTLVNINFVRGSAFDDTLLGSDSKVLTEFFFGQEGNDVINGRGGRDMARYDNAPRGVTVNLAAGTASGGDGDDILLNIEMVRGSDFDDVLVGGNPANDAFEAFEGQGGNDTIDGGSGYDRAEYGRSTAGAAVTLGGAGAGTALDGVGGTDTLISIEGVSGSRFNDVLTGSDVANVETFEGRDGDDQIDGKGGRDRAEYTYARGSVTVDLSKGTAADGYGGTDTLANIEDVWGSHFADSITGGAGDNELGGGPRGDDVLDGGAGTDTALFIAASTGFRIEKTGNTFKVVDEIGEEGADTLLAMEKLQFADKTFDLVNLPRSGVPAYNTNSGFLFDAVYYLLDNPELVPTLSLATALQHYFATGAAQGKQPNSWFDPNYYENRWPDLTAGNFSDDILFMHYNLYGVWEGRSAGPVFDQFDGNRYLADNPDVAAYVDAFVNDFLGSRTNGAIAHYVIYGQHEQRLAYDLVGQQIKLDYVIDFGG
jgi:Ca2+-binding RTX toxin-like protein